jgi:menaquinone-specific isochorismate synthase
MRKEILRCDLIDWLSCQRLYPKVYWQDQQTRAEHAAVGSILSMAEMPRFDSSTSKETRFFGGMCFPGSKREPDWKAFGACRFWLPACEMVQADKTELIFHDPETAIAEAHPMRPMSMQLLKRQEAISREKWKDHIATIHRAMLSDIEKVVLARKSTFYFSEPVCIWPWVKQLKEPSVRSSIFAFQLAPEIAFFGASPEKLFYRKKEQLFIDALAGTRKRGKDGAEDLSLERALRTDPKERLEFQMVKDFIQRALQPLALAQEWWEQDRVLKTAHVQHLHNQASVRLKEFRGDEEIVRVLHPTPALAGVPREKALALIDACEPFQRGWYGAPVGWVSPEETHLAVAIRSGLACGDALHLFAGAGIVAQSLAEREWEETEHKMGVLLDGCGIS